MKFSTWLSASALGLLSTAHAVVPNPIDKMPPSGSTQVLTNEEFILGFDADIALGSSGTIKFFNTSTATADVTLLANSSAEISVSGNMVKFMPGMLNPNQNYAIHFTSDAFTDLSAINNVTAFTTSEWTFSTGAHSSYDQLQAGGYGHSFLIDNQSLYATGQNPSGQLGTSGPGTNNFVDIGGGANYKTVTAGDDFGFAIKTDGSLWSWGLNVDGQLAQNNNSDLFTLTQVGTDTNWKFVAAGGRSVLAIKDDGTLWGSGKNHLGQLGDGSQADMIQLTPIGSDTDWQSVAVGYDHAAGIKMDGSLWSWGHNGFGQLGTGAGLGDIQTTPIQVSTGPWKAVSVGGFHTLAIHSDGSLHGCGKNSEMQLGSLGGSFVDSLTPIGTDMDWKAVAAGSSHSLMLKQNGDLYSAGSGIQGQLGGTPVSGFAPVSPGTFWKSIGAGPFHSFGREIGSMIYSWGKGRNGQLGTGTNMNEASPAPVTLPAPP